MCGLVALINKTQNGFNKSQQEVFSSLLFIDALRGMDSTGVFSVNNSGEVFVTKEATDSLQFMKSKEYDEQMKRVFSRGSAIIGHNRKATRGKINDENAHPFIVDNNIVLVHNGTMFGDHKKHADVEVDSHAIAHLIHEKGDVEQALSAFNGAYALIWYDFKNKQINMVRNNERPLWWMETNNSWIYSSERAMLDFVSDRHNLDVKDGPNELPEEVLQTFTLKNSSWGVDDRALKITVPTYHTSGTQINSSALTEHYSRRRALEEAFGMDGTDWSAWAEDYIPTNHTPSQPPFRKFIQQREQLGDALESAVAKANAANDKALGKSSLDEPPEFAGIDERERQLARSSQKVVTYGQYIGEVHPQYPVGEVVEAIPFDYRYVNGTDSSDGFYLYASPINDPDVIIRHYYSSRVVREDRVVVLAGSDYLFQFQLGRRGWRPMNEAINNHTLKTPGFCVIQSVKAELKQGNAAAKFIEAAKEGALH